MTSRDSTTTSTEAAPDRATIERSLALLFPHGHIIEVRGLKTRPRRAVDVGYFDDQQLAADALMRMRSPPYVVMNQLNPAILARYQNRIEQNAESGASDADIIRRRWLLVDLDPVRPRDVSASEDEKQLAVAAARKITRAMMDRLGWPAPVVADSGNGVHLLWSIDEPADDGTRDLVKQCLEALAAEFDSPAVKVDRSVFNAARIIGAYGTVKRKGDSTVERPHRTSRLIYVPPALQVLERQRMQALAAQVQASAPPAPATRQDGRSGAFPGRLQSVEDLQAWASRHGLAIRQVSAMGTGWKLPLDTCPFNEDHRGGEASLFWRDDKPGFKCLHSSCSGYGWRQLRERLDPRPAQAPQQGGFQVPARMARAVQQAIERAPHEPPADEVLDAAPPADAEEDEHISPHLGPGGFTLTSTGKKVANAANLILEFNARGIAQHIHFDSFRQQVLTTLFDSQTPRPWSDQASVRLMIQLQRVPDYARCTRAMIDDAAMAVAMRNTVDPVLEWLRGLRWDGEPRLDMLAAKGYGCPDNETARLALKNMVVASCARQFNPGAKYDCMVILEGPQGGRKSTSIAALFSPEYVTEWDRHVDSKDFYMQMEGKLVIELAELSSLRRSESEAIKSVLSKQVDIYRPPYSAHKVTRPRRTIFVGSTNESHYLVDSTGNRRMLPVPCGQIDTGWIALNRAQLMAEAVQLVAQGHDYWTIPGASEAQEQRRITDPWEDAIARQIEAGTVQFLLPEELLDGLLRVPRERQDMAAKRRVNAALSRMGWRQAPHPVRRDGRRARWWLPPDDGQPRPEALPPPAAAGLEEPAF